MTQNTYILLHGAIRNVGDFLIFERARELIQTYRKVGQFIELPRWLSLKPYLDVINASSGVILCGGPGYARDFYPGVFPFTSHLTEIRVPIIPLGLGWSGKPSTSTGQFTFTPQSRKALEYIHAHIRYSSVRDVITERILKQANIDNVVTSGCPAWYHLPSVDRDFTPPKAIKHVVVSTPAQPANFAQAAQLIQFVAHRFPKSERYLVFHRGILPDKNKTMRKSVLEIGLVMYGKLRGYRIIDASYSVRKIDFYQACDLHIGYRVHAHIDFLSLRKPSILIQEDGRGVGQSETLQTEDVWAEKSSALTDLEIILDRHLATNFSAFERTIGIMQDKHKVMRAFLESF